MKQNILSILCGLSVLSATALMVACQTDTDGSAMKMPGDPIEFGAVIYESDEVRTRGTLVPVRIASEPFDMDFYIQLCCRPEGSDKTISKIGTYVVPSGFEGILASKEGGEYALMWHDLTSPHTFYAWNIPWNDDETDAYKDNGRYNPNLSDDASKITKGIEIKFYDSSVTDGKYDKYKNNAIYENFIGTKSEQPYSYKEHGKYVDLTFHHLVSKIRIGSFVLIESDGAIIRNLKADLTFVGMPTEATFYPHPEDDEKRPCVVYDKEGEWKDQGVTFYINNEPEKDEFYICPEVDFDKIDFKVKIANEAYKDYDTYYGTFHDVEFARGDEDTDDYDWKKGEQQGLDKKILHAGEMMTLNIVLIPGVGPGLSLVINDWSVDEKREAQYHPHQGIFSDAELDEILQIFLKQTEYKYDEIKKAIERLFELYGKTTEDGKKYFPLFDNVKTNADIFPIWREFIIDGMGHIISMGMHTGVFPDSHPYYNIGPVRDVWLTDSKGNHTIYIDKNGYVWVYDATLNDYKQTEYYLTELTGEEKSYDIDSVTGEVRKSNYYNNTINR